MTSDEHRGADRAASFLGLIRRSQRGRLKIYLGYGPGVGKTYQMLQEGHRLRGEKIDVVIGLVETHGRTMTAKLVDGLEVVSRRVMQYHGIAVEEMDVDAVLVRRPQVVLVDELAHTNSPDGRNEKRYQDVQDLLAAGIHVITTLNIQHLESLYDTVERQVGVKVRERIPDSIIAEADQVVNVDLAPEDLQRRLQRGDVYPKERIPAAMENYFRQENLEQLRELTLRELAAQIDFRRREVKLIEETGAPDQVMVCLSSRGPNSARLLRFASRLAGRLNRNWYAVYVQTPTEAPTIIDAGVQRLLAETLTLANQLGAMVFTFKGEDVADTIIRFAREYRVGQVVIGKPRPVPWWKRLIGHASVAHTLITKATGVTVVVVDADIANEVAQATQTPSGKATGAFRAISLSTLLDKRSVVVWNETIDRRRALQDLVTAVASIDPTIEIASTVALLEEREKQGSTFLNEGIALPHARLAQLATPHAALGICRRGVRDLPSDQQTSIIFMLLTPAENATLHLRGLAAAGRVFQNRNLLRKISGAAGPDQVMAEIREWEESRS